MIAGFVRGLSVRDVEATVADALGSEAALSKSTVSRVCAAIKTEFERWRERRLDDLDGTAPVSTRPPARRLAARRQRVAARCDSASSGDSMSATRRHVRCGSGKRSRLQ